jgi:hypothetical protein
VEIVQNARVMALDIETKDLKFLGNSLFLENVVQSAHRNLDRA